MKKIYKCINGCDLDACEVSCYNNNPPTKCVYFPNHVVDFVLQEPVIIKTPSIF